MLNIPLAAYLKVCYYEYTMKKKEIAKESTTVRLNKDIREALQEEAEKEHRSFTNMLEHILIEYIEKKGGLMKSKFEKIETHLKTEFPNYAIDVIKNENGEPTQDENTYNYKIALQKNKERLLIEFSFELIDDNTTEEIISQMKRQHLKNKLIQNKKVLVGNLGTR